MSSPGFRSALMYLYFTLLTLYFLTNPSFFKIFPMVRASITIPVFASCQCIFLAHFLVFFLIPITFSLSHMGVSLQYRLGSVDCGSRASSPPCLYAAHHRSRLRCAIGAYLCNVNQFYLPLRNREYPPQTLFFNCFCHTYSHFPILGETAKCVCTLPHRLDRLL